MLRCLISKHEQYYCLQYVWVPVNFQRSCQQRKIWKLVKVNPLVGCKVEQFLHFSSCYYFLLIKGQLVLLFRAWLCWHYNKLFLEREKLKKIIFLGVLNSLVIWISHAIMIKSLNRPVGRQTAQVEHTKCLCVTGAVDGLHGSISPKNVETNH